ncbi:MAG TPA: polysaccharide deacetylase family protein [Chthonomonadaceae bacterium]|nr:polysaccharide deacetylase family protein [Chthonomonadaceae bacterium]
MPLRKSNTDSATPRDSLPRRLLRSRVGRALGLLALLLVGSGLFWYNEHRTLTWGQTLNPMYWWRRLHGEDLYDPNGAILLHGNRSLPEVALTFDDGPHIQSRGQILDTLKRYGVHATFFDVGRRMAENPDLLRRTLAEGHEVGNHSYHHLRLTSLSPQKRHREINDVDITFYRITGQHLSLLRPPGMRYNQNVLATTQRLGYILVGCNTLSADFNFNETIDFIVNRTVNRTENGSIILLHDYPNTAVALPRIIEALRAEGYRFVTIHEMIEHLPERQRLAANLFLQAHAANIASAAAPQPAPALRQVSRAAR